MYLNTQLKRLGFEVEEIDFDKGWVSYLFQNEKVKVYVHKEFQGKITMNYYETDKPRELEFSINVMKEENFIIDYIEEFLKHYQ